MFEILNAVAQPNKPRYVDAQASHETVYDHTTGVTYQFYERENDHLVCVTTATQSNQEWFFIDMSDWDNICDRVRAAS